MDVAESSRSAKNQRHPKKTGTTAKPRDRSARTRDRKKIHSKLNKTPMLSSDNEYNNIPSCHKEGADYLLSVGIPQPWTGGWTSVGCCWQRATITFWWGFCSIATTISGSRKRSRSDGTTRFLLPNPITAFGWHLAVNNNPMVIRPKEMNWRMNWMACE